MKSKFAMQAIVLTILAFAPCMVPCEALAQSTPSSCSDSTVQQNRQKYQQELSQQASNINQQTPPANAYNQCQQNALGNMVQLPSNINQFGVILSTLTKLIGSGSGGCSSTLSSSMLSKLPALLQKAMSSGGSSGSSGTASQLCSGMPTFNPTTDASLASSAIGGNLQSCSALQQIVGGSLTGQ
jgi:hypothetical protein